jgi:hypothetical protein
VYYEEESDEDNRINGLHSVLNKNKRSNRNAAIDLEYNAPVPARRINVRDIDHALNSAIVRLDDFIEATVTPHQIDAMDRQCGYCRALTFHNEAPGLCCNNGKTEFIYSKPPDDLMT